MNNLEESEEIKKRQVLPEKDAGDFQKYGIRQARRYDSSKYQQHEFKREMVRNYQTKYEYHFRKEKIQTFLI